MRAHTHNRVEEEVVFLKSSKMEEMNPATIDKRYTQATQATTSNNEEEMSFCFSGLRGTY